MVGQPAIIYINVRRIYSFFKKVISIIIEHDHLVDKSALAERDRRSSWLLTIPVATYVYVPAIYKVS